MAHFSASAAGIDFDLLDLAPLAFAQTYGATPTSLGLSVGGVTTQIFGSGFFFPLGGLPTTGVIERIVVGGDVGTFYDIQGLTIPAQSFRTWVLAGDNASVKAALFAGADQVTGSAFGDRLRSFDGDDTLQGGGGSDVLDGGHGNDDVFGGVGNDTVTDPGGANYLRGEDGDDLLIGGAEFDDINGNMGSDTASGGPGDDWVVGGRDNDRLFGDEGHDLVYGNLGDDTLDAGAGNDILRGGQGNDVVAGGPGDDFVSGDRGDDTLSGGSGADIFHAFADSGLNRVLDFDVGSGDRVQLAAGTAFTMAQVGGDTIISLAGGQVILVGIPLSALRSDSIFLA